MNVIIIAALALIVLIVLVFIFSNRIQLFGQGAKSCANFGGKCTTTARFDECINLGTCDCKEGEIFIKGTNCEDNHNRICCKNVLGTP